MADETVTNAAISDFVTRIKQALATVDDAARTIGGLYWQASRICEFENGAAGWLPKVNADGTFAMLITDEQLAAMNFKNMTAQELGQVFFGIVNVMTAIPVDLADLVGRMRA